MIKSRKLCDVSLCISKPGVIYGINKAHPIDSAHMLFGKDANDLFNVLFGSRGEFLAAGVIFDLIYHGKCLSLKIRILEESNKE